MEEAVPGQCPGHSPGQGHVPVEVRGDNSRTPALGSLLWVKEVVYGILPQILFSFGARINKLPKRLQIIIACNALIIISTKRSPVEEDNTY